MKALIKGQDEQESRQHLDAGDEDAELLQHFGEVFGVAAFAGLAWLPAGLAGRWHVCTRRGSVEVSIAVTGQRLSLHRDRAPHSGANPARPTGSNPVPRPRLPLHVIAAFPLSSRLACHADALPRLQCRGTYTARPLTQP